MNNKALIRLRGCTGWSLLFANPPKTGFVRSRPYVVFVLPMNLYFCTIIILFEDHINDVNFELD